MTVKLESLKAKTNVTTFIKDTNAFGKELRLSPMRNVFHFLSTTL